ncbi:unnamed protein product [Nezara viridula]|uniref:BTB domain-containing protein n=1 Tax=Nezara viridula TaxID=85310 RepID=A0A9P0HTN4_NEZVI|nr:unnamed protein product [Nezara viridula]
MGNTLRSLVDYCPDSLAVSISEVYSRRKGKRKLELENKEENEWLECLQQPKTKKLLSTAHYIYQALFVDGKDSDITVNILNKDFKLHRVYLGQSQYFNSMFSGSWKESSKDYISIVVEDPNITLDALTIVLGSFYLDEVKLEPCMVVGVLAASTMFQMDGLIEQCCEIMYESASPVTAVQYYQVACNYGLQKVKEKVLNWFLVNIIDYYSKNPKRLREIDIDLMSAIVSHPGLCIIQTEMNLYFLLRKWLYLQLHPDVDLTTCKNDPCEIFFKKSKETNAFLLTSKGLPYLNIFRNLRLDNLILHPHDVPIITADRIIPESWFQASFKNQWLAMLDIFSGNKGVESIEESEFLQNCYRCGRVISTQDSLSWRWSGFSFGIDLVWSMCDNIVTLRRNRSQLEFANSYLPHHIVLKVEVMNLNEKRQVKRFASSGMLNVSLLRGQEINVLTLDSDFDYPMYIIIHHLLRSKEKEKEKEKEKKTTST